MSTPAPNTSLFDQVMANLPNEVARTLTDYQVSELKHAFRHLTWRKHPVDIRFSIPFPGRGLYVVFLAGPERRSRERLRIDARQQARQNFMTLAITSMILGAIAIGAFFKVVQPTWTFVQQSPSYPTVLPWLQSQQACEDTGRIWRDNHCWDTSNDPNF